MLGILPSTTQSLRLPGQTRAADACEGEVENNDVWERTMGQIWRPRRSLILPALLASAVAVLPAPVLAQAPDEPTQDQPESFAVADDEIIVTARRRQERALELPDSVSVLSEQTIARAGIQNIDDIGALVPNLTLATRADGVPNVSIRGVGSFGNTQGVGFYLDDVQLFSDASSRFGDLERIEVLRGPQGTLYGGSNIGGAVKFISARPDPDGFFGRVSGAIGGQQTREIEASLNVPIGGSWAMRLFGFATSNDGFLVNTNPARLNGLSGTNDPDVGAVRERGGRIAIGGDLTERLSLFANLRWSDYEGPANAWIVELGQDYGYSKEVNTTFNPRLERETLAGSVELNYALDRVTITSLTSFTSTNPYDQSIDLDISPEYVVDLFRPQKFDIFTQELRFTSAGSGPFKWLAGLYYVDFAEEMDSRLVVYESGDVLGAGGIPTAQEEANATSIPFEDRERNRQQIAGFLNASYRLGDFELGAGIRVDRWEAETLNRQTGLRGRQSSTEILPRLSLSYFLDGRGSNIYATYSRGYEPGGFNLSNFAGSNELFGFGPERADSFELGVKGSLLGGRLTATAALFYIRYTGRQFELQTSDPNTGDLIEGVLNAGDSRQWGAEFDLRWRMTNNLTLSMGGGFVDAQWDDGTVLDGGMDISGLKPPYMQRSSFTAALDYDQPIADDLNLNARVQLSHSGRFETDLGNTFYNPSSTVVNARLGIARSNWELALNIENIFDERYYTDTTLWPNFNPLLAPPVIIGTLGQPRLMTAQIRVNF